MVEGDALVAALKNSAKLATIILTPQHEYSAKQIKRLKEFFKDFFEVPSEGGDAKSLAIEAAAEFSKLSIDLGKKTSQVAQFPFLEALKPLTADVRNAVGKPYEWYLSELPKIEDQFLDAAEDIWRPVKSFMDGSQRTTYESAQNYLNEQSDNFSAIQSDLPEIIRAILNDLNCYKGSAIKDLKGHLSNLQSEVTAKVSEERKAAGSVLDDSLKSIEELAEFSDLSDDNKTRMRCRFDGLRHDIAQAKLIAVIRSKAMTAKDDLLPKVMNDVIAMATPPAPTPEPKSPGSTPQQGDGFRDPPAPTPAPAPRPTPTVVLSQQVKVEHPKSLLTTDEDVDDYINRMRDAWIAEIRRGKRIKV